MHTMQKSTTYRLIKQHHNFINGLASLMDFSETTAGVYNLDTSREEADANAIASDWQAVGNDLRMACGF